LCRGRVRLALFVFSVAGRARRFGLPVVIFPCTVAHLIPHFVAILGCCFHPDFSLRPPIKSVLLLQITLM
jgi:hypothetical protein